MATTPATATITQTSASSVFPQVFRQRRSDVDCGTKICFLTHKLLDNCYLYVHTNSTLCDIPCNLNGCGRELHHFIDCPIWQCQDYRTTTKATTSTTTATTTTAKSTTTTMPNPTTTNFAPVTFSPLPPLDHPVYLYSSIAFNILLVLVLLTVLIKKCKKALVRRFRNRRERNGDVETNSILRATNGNRRNQAYGPINDAFSVATSSSEDFDTRETIPLIGRASNRRSRNNPHPTMPTLSTTAANVHATPPTLPRTAPAVNVHSRSPPPMPSCLNSPVLPSRFLNSPNTFDDQNNLLDENLDAILHATEHARRQALDLSNTLGTSTFKPKPKTPVRTSSLTRRT